MTNATALEEMSPTDRLVYLILDNSSAPLTKDHVAERSHSPKRSVRRALHRLEDEGLVESRTVPGDARKTVYSTIN